MLPRVAVLALEQQQLMRRADIRRASGAGVNGLHARQEHGPPPAQLRPDQPVSLLVVEEEALVERADVGERRAPNEQARAPGGIHGPGFEVIPVEHAVLAWLPPTREA